MFRNTRHFYQSFISITRVHCCPQIKNVNSKTLKSVSAIRFPSKHGYEKEFEVCGFEDCGAPLTERRRQRTSGMTGGHKTRNRVCERIDRIRACFQRRRDGRSEEISVKERGAEDRRKRGGRM